MSSTEPQDRALQKLFQDLPRERAPGEECPAPEEIWASALGELAPEKTREVVAHTGRCPSCAEDWRLARHINSTVPGETRAYGETRTSDEIRTTRPVPRAWRTPWLLAAAASLLLAVLLAAFWMISARSGDRKTIYRAESRYAIELLIPEDQPLSRDLPTLRWRGPEGATYRLVVTTERLRLLVHEERLTESEYRLPSELTDALSSGSVILWQLEATLADGSRLPSQTFRVRLE